MLLDTQALIWFSHGNRRLGEEARERILEAALTGGALVSPISFWEVAMLVSKGKISFPAPVGAWAAEICGSENGPMVAELSPAIAADAGQLPWDAHGDPADRIIIATARALNVPVMTSDEKILAYAEAGHVQAIDARR